ncbi:MAG: recombinase A [Myxococcota bacterium]|nr:recombinase A [Myxococcota bacterium]
MTFQETRARVEAPQEVRFAFDQLAGRLIELSSHVGSSVLTTAVGLILAAQRDGAPAAWIGPPHRLFFPPDLADSGVDLAALAVVRVREVHLAVRSADRLLRSGAFGIVVIDIGDAVAHLSLAAQSRLASLAQKHRSIVACLTEKPASNDSLGSLVSLRAEAKRERTATTLLMLKDKRHGPGWAHHEECRGPLGLR